MWVAPTGFISPAPGHAARWFVIILLALVGLAFVFSVLNPGGVLPGIAESSRTDNHVTLTFDAGDRYFWLPSNPTPNLHAAQLLAELPGRQALVQRANYQDTHRITFDEDHPPGPDNPDYELHPDYLYEVHGVQTDATIQYTDTGHSTGRDFLNDIRDNSHTVLRRLWNQLRSVPAIVLDDLRHVGDDVSELFQDRPNSDHDGAARSLVSTLRSHWELLAALGLLMVLAPLAGAGPLAIGILGGLILLSGGSTPFYVLAALCAGTGVVLDADGPRQVLGTLGLKASVGAGDLAFDYPHTAQGVIVYVVGAAASLALGWFGHVQLLAVVMLVTGAAALFLMSRPGDENGANQNPLSGLHVVPGVLIAVLGLLNAVVLLQVGFEGFAMAFLIVASIVGYQVILRHLRLRRRLHQDYLHALGQGPRPGKAWEIRAEQGFTRYVNSLAGWTRVAYAVILVFLYLGVAAAARRDWFTFCAHLLVGLLALVGTWILGRRFSERNLEESS